MVSGEHDEDRFPLPHAGIDGSVYVDEFEVAWVCEHEPDLGYIWRSLGPPAPPEAGVTCGRQCGSAQAALP